MRPVRIADALFHASVIELMVNGIDRVKAAVVGKNVSGDCIRCG